MSTDQEPDSQVAPDPTAEANTFPVDASHATGVQVGEGNTQYVETHLYFGGGVERTRRVESDSVAEVCPYPTDMAAFRPEDAEWFFGRDRLVAELIERLDQRFQHGGGPLVVVAPSGAGKSSLLQAGLIPKLEQGALLGSQHWPGLRITPTEHPVTALAEAIARVTRKPPAEVARQLTDDPDRCIEDLRATLRTRVGGTSARLVLIVDQLEELFTVCTDERERHRFLDLISHLTGRGTQGQDPVALVVYGLRADFYAHCADYPQLHSAVQDSPMLVGPMSSTELRQAIQHPAQRAGLRVDAGLVDLLLRDLGASPVDGAADAATGGYEAGRLPLLAHALRATWRERHGHTLTVDGYRLTGGIQHAASTTAERVFEALEPEEQRAARALFLRMVKIGDGTEDTRRRVPCADLLGSSIDQKIIQTVLDVFTRDRLLTQGRDTVEITHEVLLRAWPRLRGWINEDRTGNLVRQQLNEAAAAWESEGRDTGALYRGARLEAAREQAQNQPYQDDLSPIAHEFLHASIRHERRGTRRRRRQLTALSILTVLLLIASIVAFATGQNAAHQRDIATSRQLASDSEKPATDPRISRLESLAAWGITPSVEAHYAMLAAATRPEIDSLDLTNNSDVFLVTLSPDGTSLAIGANPTTNPTTGVDVGGGVEVWDLRTGQQIGNTIDPGDEVSSAAFSPDGKTIAIATGSATGADSSGVQVWDLRTGQQIGNSIDPTGAGSVAFSPDGKTLATVDNGGVEVWDLRTGQQIGDTITSSNAAGSVAFSPDGKTLATGTTSGAQVWDLRTGQQIGNTLPADAVGSVAFSPDGKTLATATNTGTTGGAQVWDLRTGRQIGKTLAPSSLVTSVAFSPDGKTLTTGTEITGGSGGGAQVWDLGTGQQIGNTLAPSNVVHSVAFSPDGKTLTTGTENGSGGGAQVWDLGTGQQIGNTLAPSGLVGSVAFSPDGKSIAITTGNGLGGAQVWDLGTGRQIGNTLDPGQASSVAFSPDGTTLATGGYGGAQVWDLRTGQQIGNTLARSLTVGSVAFSPDGKTLATGTIRGGVEVWDLGTGRQIGNTLAPSNAVNSVAFSPDGKTLAIGGNGGAQLWDLGTGRQIGNTLAPSNAVNSVAFSPDGKTLATGDGDGAQLWDVAYLVDVQRRLCTEVGASLTPQFWAQYVPPGPTYRNICS